MDVVYDETNEKREWLKRYEQCKTIDDKQRMMSEYCKTHHWQAKRDERRAIDGEKCFICGSRDKIKVHHKGKYESILWNEDVERDLVTLCNTCHHKLHEFKEKEKLATELSRAQLVQDIIKAVVRYNHDKHKRFARYISEMPPAKLRGKGTQIESIVWSIVEPSMVIQSVTVKFGDEKENRITNFPSGDEAAVLARILRGKKKPGQINTEEEWDASWEV